MQGESLRSSVGALEPSTGGPYIDHHPRALSRVECSVPSQALACCSQKLVKIVNLNDISGRVFVRGELPDYLRHNVSIFSNFQLNYVYFAGLDIYNGELRCLL